MHVARFAAAGALLAAGITFPLTGTASATARHPRPATHTHLRAGVSANWAGPAITGGAYSGVRTTFVVPAVSCPAGGGFMIASFWAGLDGAAAASDTVEQAGLEVACEYGTAAYQAWTEEFPAPSTPVPAHDFSPSPGDRVTVSVAARGGTDTYTFRDLTSGRHYTTSAAAPRGARGASAECIVEAPTGRRGLEQLTDFGTVSFSGCRATLAGLPGACQVVSGAGCPSGSRITVDNIVGFRHHILPQVKATTEPTGAGGFAVTWHHA